MATLIIQLPNMPPVEHVLKDEAITIGRMRGNSIALDDSSVSLSHAKLTRIDGAYHIKDLNSTNGTLLNGQSVSEARLHDGDYVKFGEVTGRFHADASALTSQPGSPAVVPAAPRPPVTAANSPARPLKPKKSLRLESVLAGAGVAVVAGCLAWKFLLSGSTAPTSAPPPRPPTAPAPAQAVRSEQPAAPSPPASTPAATAAPSANQDVPALIQALKDSDPRERRRAATALNALGPEVNDAVPALRDALKDSDAEVRNLAALSLLSHKVYDKATVPIFIQMLNHESPVLRQLACLSLALIPYEAGEKEPVITALSRSAAKDDNAEVRSAAVSALKLIAPESAPTK